MSDNPIAGFLTVIAVAPLCLVCALGPVAFVAAGGSFLAWLGGFGVPLLVASALAIGSWLAWRAFQRRLPSRGDRQGRSPLSC